MSPGRSLGRQASAVVIIGLSKIHRILVSKHFAKKSIPKIIGRVNIALYVRRWVFILYAGEFLSRTKHKHPVSASDFKILSSGTSEWNLLIRESLLISQLKLTLSSMLILDIPLLSYFSDVILTLTIY
jgi:hypothetical protein